MADVARKAGVSVMTVSRTLRGDGSVANDTRERIRRAVDELGYVLDLTAGALSSQRTDFVSVLIPSVDNSNFSETLYGISEVLEANGHQVLLGDADYSLIKEEKLIETMLKRRTEGIVVTGGVHTERARRLLRQAAIPVIEIWDLPENPIDHVVGFSNALTIEDLVPRLLHRGYRRIAFIGGDEGDDFRGVDRRRGYEHAVEVLGLPRKHVVPLGPPPISIKHGGQAVVRLMEEWPAVEAVICVSDLPAAGALMECHRRNWKVPERLAVAGFGNFEISQYSWPSITTVSINCEDMGRQAGALMLEAIEAARAGKRLAPQIRKVPHSIIEREST